MKMVLEKAKHEDAKEILKLYEAQKGKGFCTWDEYYPSILNVKEDIDAECLFIYKKCGKIISAVSIAPQNELDGYDVWKYKNSAEIARVCVSDEYKGNGLAYKMVSELIRVIKSKGFDAIHLSVAVRNVPAVKTYKKLGFDFLLETEMYDNIYCLCEKVI